MRRVVPALAALAFFAACSDTTQSPTVFDPPSNNAAVSATDRYIVVLDQAPDGQVSTVTRIAAQLGVSPVQVYEWALPGFAADLTPDRVAELERSPLVNHVSKDQEFTITGNQSPTPSWGLDRVDQDVPGGDPALDNSYTFPNSAGAGVEVYVFDTGLNFSHNDFTGRTGSGFDATGGGSPDDGNGHGTHVTGTVAGTTYGIAKSAGPIEPVQVCNSSGSCFTSWITNGINWAIGNVTLPAVGNMSLGGGANSTLDAAVANAVSAGIFMSVSAGNSGANACNFSPAREPSAHTSGATDINDNRASFSNFGTCVDAFGPGVSITSAWIGGANATNTISGTSMSSPHHAGIGALHLGENPGDSPAQVDAAIKNNALVGVVNNPGSGSPNLLVNMNYLNGGAPPPGDNPPVSDWSVSCSGNTCTFDGSASSDDNGIVLYEWIFNGNVIRTGVSFTHTFSQTRTITLTLRVTDTVGQTDSNTQTHTLPSSPPPTDNPPVASWVVTCAGTLCTFDGSGSTDDNGIVLYEWIFNGNVIRTGVSFQFNFADPRTITLTLQVTDTVGQQDTDTQTHALPN